MDIHGLIASCAPEVAPQTMLRVLKTESSHNPYAIGVVGARLQRQPQNLPEAVATAKYLAANGYKFSAGIGQIYYKNWPRFGLNFESVFDPCMNLKASATILRECYEGAATKYRDQQYALRAAFSCYYSGSHTSREGWSYASKVAGDRRSVK